MLYIPSVWLGFKSTNLSTRAIHSTTCAEGNTPLAKIAKLFKSDYQVLVLLHIPPFWRNVDLEILVQYFCTQGNPWYGATLL